jgi:hypothetical protein
MPSTITQKLKIKEGDILLTLHAPADFKKNLGALPTGVTIITEGKAYNQLHWFATSKTQVEKETKKVLSLLKDGVICWIYFPKGTSKIQTDLTRDKGWESLLAHNDKLAWLVLVSFDGTWSAFSVRLKKATDKSKVPKAGDRPILQYIDAKTKTVRLPDDLALAFKKNKVASDYFNTLAYSHRKEYVEWIVTAKQEATRKSRVDGTIERLAKQWKNPGNL